MAKQKAKTTHEIGDKKKRGEWVEMKFMAEAAERSLPTAKPFGDSENFFSLFDGTLDICRHILYIQFVQKL